MRAAMARLLTQGQLAWVWEANAPSGAYEHAGDRQWATMSYETIGSWSRSCEY